MIRNGLLKTLAPLALLALPAIGCGGIDYEYNAEKYAQAIRHETPRGVELVEIVDTRTGVLDDPETRAEDVDELRLAFHEHLKIAGIISEGAALAPAPKTSDDVEKMLDDAAARGVPEVVFFNWRASASTGYQISLAFIAGIGGIGLIPWLIVDSLPLSRHQGSAIFAAISVDPKTREVLHMATPLGTYGEKVNAWGWSPPKIMVNTMGPTVQAALEEIARARHDGFPNRRSVEEIGKLVLAFEENRIEGGDFVGVGFRVPVPEGYSFAEQELVSGEEKDVKLVALHTPTLLRADDQLEELEEDLEEAYTKLGLTIDSKEAGTLGGHPAMTVKSRNNVGDLSHQKLVLFHGWQLTLTCKGPKGAAAQVETCANALEKATFNVATLPID